MSAAFAVHPDTHYLLESYQSNAAEINQMLAIGTNYQASVEERRAGAAQDLSAHKTSCDYCDEGKSRGEPIPKSRWVFNGASQIPGIDGGFSTTNLMRCVLRVWKNPGDCSSFSWNCSLLWLPWCDTVVHL
jgi:hypothetical protein